MPAQVGGPRFFVEYLTCLCARSGVLDLHQVLHNANHPFDLGIMLMLHGLVHFAKAERRKGQLLAL